MSRDLARAADASVRVIEAPAAGGTHPRGLLNPVLTEGWERFSYYAVSTQQQQRPGQ